MFPGFLIEILIVVLIVALIFWRRPAEARGRVPKEHLVSAMRAGVRFVSVHGRSDASGPDVQVVVDRGPLDPGAVRVELYAWLKTGQKGLFASLLGTQFARKGDSMGGGGAKAGADEFDDVADGADAGDFS